MRNDGTPVDSATFEQPYAVKAAAKAASATDDRDVGLDSASMTRAAINRALRNQGTFLALPCLTLTSFLNPPPESLICY
jgi:hypothetical protein